MRGIVRKRLDPAYLRHELDVHQTQLEMQNEELRRTRGELERSVARYTDIFDHAPIGYATLDASNAICSINAVGADLLGCPRSRLVGARFGDLLANDAHATFCALAAQARRSDRPESCEVYLDRDDAPVLLRVTATARPVDSVLLAFEDITDRTAEQERLAEADRALRAADQRKDELIAMLSHELRNPLAPIRTSLFVLTNADSDSEMWSEAHGIIERQVTHLTRLVDDLLDVTRLSRGKIRLQRQRADLRDLVQRTVDDHRAGVEDAGVALAVDLPPTPTWVEVDPARFAQVVGHVLGNAQKFTPAGGHVAIELRTRGGRAELRVRDDGVGIAPELLPFGFGAFTQAPQSIDRGRGGLGLGLAMVRGLIALHGGTVDITSAGLDRGTELRLTLPLASERAVVPAEVRLPLASRRVLVIEDQPDTARALQTALTLLGLEVRTASTGPAGFEIARKFRPQVVLCDIGLPDMDGHEIARAFRRDRELRDTFLVALSGYAQPEDVERASAAGFSCHIAKPASLDTLVRVIAEAP